MPDIYEVEAPDGSILELESDHPPTPAEVLKAVRAYGDSLAAQMQTRLQRQDPRSGEFWTPSAEGAGRFAAGLWNTVNPLNLVKAALSPIDTVSNIWAAHGEQGGEALAAAKEGRVSEAIGHGAATLLPVLGPIAASAGEAIAGGDVAGGLGTATGLLAPVGVSAALRARTKAQPRTADMLTRQAEEQVAQRVLAPGNPAFRGRAQAVAPDVLKRMKGGRDEIRQAAQEGMADAATAIDDAIQTAGGTQGPVPVAPIIGTLQQRIRDLQDSAGQPLSGAATRRIAAIQERLTHLKALNRQGKGTASFEDLRKLRDENYRLADEARGYERQGNPAMSDEGFAARETGGAIREQFASTTPGLSKANADYTLFKTIDDILDPAVGRPKNMTPTQGITGGARTTGAVAGDIVGGRIGAFIGGTVLPWLNARKADPAWQLADAQAKLKLAEAIRRGDMPAMRKWMVRLEQGAVTTSPSERRNRTMSPAPSVP